MASSGGFSGPIRQTNTGLAMTMAAFSGIAVYNSLELLYIIISAFKRRSGLYFWSLIVSTIGILPYSLCFMLKFYGVSKPGWSTMTAMTFVVIGWCMMVTGQSVVLYSRLHLVVPNTTKLRWILGMIIVNAVICHVPIGVLSLGANSSYPGPFVRPYKLYTNVQITIFFCQEIIISSLYVYETSKIFNQGSTVYFSPGREQSQKTRKVLRHLIAMNLIIIAMDVALLAVQYKGFFELHTVFKAMIYSIKLKMEFRILNQLIELTYAHQHRVSNSDIYHRSFKLNKGKRDKMAKTGPTCDDDDFVFGNISFVERGGDTIQGLPMNNSIQVTKTHTIAQSGMEPALVKSGDRRTESSGSSEVEFAGRMY